MTKILLYNVFFLFALSFVVSCSLHQHFIGRRAEKALERLSLVQNNPYYNTFTQKIGSLPQNNMPTSYLKIVPDSARIKVGFFGDSHTMGSEVKLGHDFPSVLQKILGNRYQIINFGQGGYNSDQIYLMATLFSKNFNLDIIVIGPRGFYTERVTSFNNYWNQGNIPHSRFILDNKKLKEIVVPGRGLRKMILNYYSFLPQWNLIRHDHVAPSFFKLSDILFGKELRNPLFSTSRNSNVRSIQITQLEELSKSQGIPILHYADLESDCEAFKKVQAPNYHLHCVQPFVHIFPYQAEVSHPSSFGHYRHAKNIEQIVFKSLPEGSKISLSDDESQYEPVKIEDLSAEHNRNDNLGVFLNERKVGKLGKIWGYQDTTGRLRTFRHHSENKYAENHIMIGFYLDGMTRANSIFMRVQATTKIINALRETEFERIRGESNVLFLKVPGLDIYHPKNKIYFDREWSSSFPANLFFTISHENKYVAYEPKYPTYKMIVDREVSALDFFSKTKSNKIKVSMRKTN